METSLLCSEGIDNIIQAWQTAQAEMPVVEKKNFNNHTKSKYANLGNVTSACLPILHKYGLVAIQTTMDSEPMTVSLITRLYHMASQEWIESVTKIPFSRQDPQAYGSALTYARRYALCAIAGIVCKDDDDDGNGAADRGRGQSTPPNSPPQNGAQKPTNGKTGSSPQSPPNLPPEIQKALSALPKLDRIHYEPVLASNGSQYCFVVKGVKKNDVRAKMLQGARFTFDEGRNLWWRYATAA